MCQRRLHFSKTFQSLSVKAPPIFCGVELNHGLHLAYCTNIHRGETWRETFESLKTTRLPCASTSARTTPFAIGLRLSNQAAVELTDPKTLLEFQRWLGKNSCYVFTINGFPYGQFHGTRVKEQVYAPDWTSPERLAYTNLLFDLLAKLAAGGNRGQHQHPARLVQRIHQDARTGNANPRQSLAMRRAHCARQQKIKTQTASRTRTRAAGPA